MIQVVWEFIVRESAVRRFLRAYGPGGGWDRLHRGCPGFLGTELLRDADNPRRFVTVDSWATGPQRARTLSYPDEYFNLDELLDDLTEDQNEIGTFRVVGPGLRGVPVRSGKKGRARGAERTSRRTRG